MKRQPIPPRGNAFLLFADPERHARDRERTERLYATADVQKPMKKPTPPEKKRAPKGKTTARLLLSLSPELLAATQKAARKAGLSHSEWWRQAAATHLVDEIFNIRG